MEPTSQPLDATQLPAWHALQEHRTRMQHFSLRDAFSQDPQRFARYSLQKAGIFLDYSKNLIDAPVLESLLQLAQQMHLPTAIEALFAGEMLNNTERRPALHTALRRPLGDRVLVNGGDVMPEVHRVLGQMTDLVQRVHTGLWRGYTEQPITDVVNIGIGGSFLGPHIVSEALRPFERERVRCHFLANLDGSEFMDVSRQLRAETTLFIVSSKSFGTLETLKNTMAARRWFLAQGGKESDLARHFIAVTSNRKAAIEFGMAEENLFPMWDWVGGRYSLWSAIGLPIALAIGMSGFRELLAGAYEMDQHFAYAPLHENLPVLLGLLGVWYGDFWGAQSHAVLPYDHYLRNLNQHLQQLDMESNGKRVRQDGSAVSCGTGPVIWGGVGCNGQHAYHQLLHQGTSMIPVDFIIPATSYNPVADHHQWLYANALAQSQALMRGKTLAEAEAELRIQGLPESEVQRLAPHKVIPGNRPSNMLVLESVNPRSLGALIALYEHKVFVQSVMWGINAFDQWGVELGKELGKHLYARLIGTETAPAEDASTQGLIDLFRSRHRG
ncbi:MAG: glucose-6-phosphate isomerase [Pseudomonas sp.]